MENLETHIVPWALPREEIPLSVKWPKAMIFDRIVISIPKSLELKDLINVEEYRANGNIIEITKVNVTESLDMVYFGAVVSTRELPQTLTSSESITIEFVYKNEVINRTILSTRVFRPFLQVMNFPEKVILTDPKVEPLPIKLSFTGFGDINVKIEAELAGKIISETHTIISELFRRLLSSLSVDKHTNNDNPDEKLKIDENYIKYITTELEKSLSTDYFAVNGIAENDVQSIKEWFDDIRKSDEFFLILYNKVGSLMVELVDELLSSNPSDNIRYEHPVRLKGNIKAPVENLHLMVYYSDLLGNIYDPIDLNVKLEDNRNTKGIEFQINVVVESVKNEPLMNVAEMKLT
jgi:hypothetical protein